MKKKYIKPIIEYCPLESDIIAASVDANIKGVDDTGATWFSPVGQPILNQKDGVHAPAESKDNFWNNWEDDDMEFEF